MTRGSSENGEGRRASCDAAFWQLERLPPDDVALIEPNGRQLSYATLKDAADAAAEHFPNVERVVAFILFEHQSSAVAIYLGALRRRMVVPLLLQPSIDPGLLAALAMTYEPAWIACPRCTVLPELYRLHGEIRGYGLYVRSAASEGSPPHPDCGLLLSTSGSTGSPKLVRLSYGALAHNAASIKQYLGLTPGDRAITTLPLAYSFGMSVLNSHLMAGASLILTGHSVLTREFWETAKAGNITSISGVPSTYAMLRRSEIEHRGLVRLRALCQAGGQLPEAETRHFAVLAKKNGWLFYVMYGQTEASPRMSYVPPERLLDKMGSIGVPIPGGSLDIDATSTEIVYRGPNVMMGYASTHQDLTKSDECGGVLCTGDFGRKDEDGFFYLTGRLKRFLKLAGNRVNLDEIELALSRAFGVSVACTGRDEGMSVVFSLEGAPADSDVRRLMRDRFNIYGGTVHIRRMEILPLLANGKIDYSVLNNHAGSSPQL